MMNLKKKNRAQKLSRFKQNISTPQDSKGLIDELIKLERDLCYTIEKITHQVVDDNYPAMKIEMFKEAIENDPEFKKKDK